MTRFVLRRLLVLPLALLGVSVVSFALTRIIPGDPTDRLVGAAFLTDERRAEIRREYGLDRPYPAQFAAYLRGLARGDLGTSFLTSRPVADDLRQRFPATLELTVAAMAFAVLVAVPLGVASAVWKGSWLDHLARLLAVLGVSMPVFWSGLLLLYLFFFLWQWAPPPIGRLEPALLAPAPVTGLLHGGRRPGRRRGGALGRAQEPHAARARARAGRDGAAGPDGARRDAGGARLRLRAGGPGLRPLRAAR